MFAFEPGFNETLDMIDFEMSGVPDMCMDLQPDFMLPDFDPGFDLPDFSEY